ncbi:acyl-CoA dehydrogenase family protein [Gordonia sp. HY002]|uniref:acyl-CoA dehydrogenase family protein n=1 Tax=Gordonia zhenghanii TaxID=2911516 RepID=UPI001EF12C53|nr:acyl-CoA dehydrogenase family protein [Gordonia zhenghanii]MCF8571330.1 acyl-CoA dehydrogenase family protein [Gordonia zhenghanii]MCF8601854.1 acyl-CoA dehydrogenase family protein [Gordonia zhenghanii]
MKRTIFETEHEQFRETVRAFLIKEAVPHTADWESAGLVDRKFWSAAAAHGMVAFSAPEEYGGAGLRDFRFNAVIDEEIVRTGAVGDGFSLTNDIVLPYYLDIATPQQQERWLPGITAGDTVIAIAMSEPGTGSDLRAIKTTAVRDDGGWRLTGSKTFITSGIQADLVIVAARIPEDDGGGFGLFVVAAGADGFEKGRKLDKIGRRAQDTAELFFADVFVPDADVLGEPGSGLHYMMGNLAQERLSMAVVATASAEYALETAVAYASERTAFGKPIGSFQANRFTLAELSTKVSIARVYIDRCIAAANAGELTAAEAAGAKFWTTELEFEALDTCLQIHGGYGYMEEFEVARRWRDARVQRIYGGTNEIMREIVGRSLGL